MADTWATGDGYEPSIGRWSRPRGSARGRPRFELACPDALRFLFAGLDGFSADAIVPTVFRDFDDHWPPFLRGQGPAPTYVASLDEAGRADPRERRRNN